MQRRNPVVPEAREALTSFKEEIARELGLENYTRAGYVGGNMGFIFFLPSICH